MAPRSALAPFLIPQTIGRSINCWVGSSLKVLGVCLLLVPSAMGDDWAFGFCFTGRETALSGTSNRETSGYVGGCLITNLPTHQ